MKKWLVCNPQQATDVEAAAVLAGIEAQGDADALIVKARSLVPVGTMYVMQDPDEAFAEWLRAHPFSDWLPEP